MITNIIGTKRTRLRPYVADSDRDQFLDLLADSEVNALTGNGVYDPEKAAALFDKILELYKSQLAARHFDIWAVELVATGDYVGHLELKETDATSDDDLEIVYMLAKKFWRQGLGTEIVTAVRDYADSIHKQVIATVNQQNKPSLDLLAKIGCGQPISLDHETLLLRLT